MVRRTKLKLLLWLGCLAAVGICWVSCKRKPPGRAEKPPDRMTHLHVQLPNQALGKWTQIVDAERFTGFERLLQDVGDSADIARRDVSPRLLGRFYTRWENRIERDYRLHEDGSLRYAHLEVFLNEDQYEFLLSILESVKPDESGDKAP